MNYFIFKNTDSRDIKGLIVQELPPITKPPMRVRRTEIEGKDGEIIEELGYQAYDKTILIGLTKGYDINEIIGWLNGSGNLLLSNELDKYYNANIIEQIDFERLARFKTAKIKFRIQPYKYKTNEEYLIVKDRKDKLISGESIDLTDSAEYKIEELNVSGNSKQEIIEGVEGKEAKGESITVNDVELSEGRISISGNSYQETREGYNLLNVDLPYVTNSSGETLKWLGVINIPKLEIEKSYFLYGECEDGTKLTGNNSSFVITNNSGQILNKPFNAYFSNTLDISEGKDCYIWTNNSLSGKTITKIALYEGTEEKPYEPYGVMPSPGYPSENKSCGDDGNINFEICNKNIAKITTRYWEQTENNTIKGKYGNGQGEQLAQISLKKGQTVKANFIPKSDLTATSITIASYLNSITGGDARINF